MSKVCCFVLLNMIVNEVWKDWLLGVLGVVFVFVDAAVVG